MRIIPVQSYNDIEAVINMAKYHPAPEYDCSFEYYVEVIAKIIPLPNVKAWIVKEAGNYVGYIIAIKDITGIMKQIQVFDIYIKDQFRNGIGKELIEKVLKWAKEEEVLRVTWTSKVPLKIWERFMKEKGCEYHHYYWENK